MSERRESWFLSIDGTPWFPRLLSLASMGIECDCERINSKGIYGWRYSLGGSDEQNDWIEAVIEFMLTEDS